MEVNPERIHLNFSSESDSDSDGKDYFDEQYYKLLPTPLDPETLEKNVVVIRPNENSFVGIACDGPSNYEWNTTDQGKVECTKKLISKISNTQFKKTLSKFLKKINLKIEINWSSPTDIENKLILIENHILQKNHCGHEKEFLLLRIEFGFFLPPKKYIMTKKIINLTENQQLDVERKFLHLKNHLDLNVDWNIFYSSNANIATYIHRYENRLNSVLKEIVDVNERKIFANMFYDTKRVLGIIPIINEKKKTPAPVTEATTVNNKVTKSNNVMIELLHLLKLINTSIDSNTADCHYITLKLQDLKKAIYQTTDLKFKTELLNVHDEVTKLAKKIKTLKKRTETKIPSVEETFNPSTKTKINVDSLKSVILNNNHNSDQNQVLLLEQFMKNVSEILGSKVTSKNKSTIDCANFKHLDRNTKELINQELMYLETFVDTDVNIMEDNFETFTRKMKKLKSSLHGLQCEDSNAATIILGRWFKIVRLIGKNGIQNRLQNEILKYKPKYFNYFMSSGSQKGKVTKLLNILNYTLKLDVSIREDDYETFIKKMDTMKEAIQNIPDAVLKTDLLEIFINAETLLETFENVDDSESEEPESNNLNIEKKATPEKKILHTEETLKFRKFYLLHENKKLHINQMLKKLNEVTNQHINIHNEDYGTFMKKIENTKILLKITKNVPDREQLLMQVKRIENLLTEWMNKTESENVKYPHFDLIDGTKRMHINQLLKKINEVTEHNADIYTDNCDTFIQKLKSMKIHLKLQEDLKKREDLYNRIELVENLLTRWTNELDAKISSNLDSQVTYDDQNSNDELMKNKLPSNEVENVKNSKLLIDNVAFKETNKSNIDVSQEEVHNIESLEIYQYPSYNMISENQKTYINGMLKKLNKLTENNIDVLIDAYDVFVTKMDSMKMSVMNIEDNDTRFDCLKRINQIELSLGQKATPKNGDASCMVSTNIWDQINLIKYNFSLIKTIIAEDVEGGGYSKTFNNQLWYGILDLERLIEEINVSLVQQKHTSSTSTRVQNCEALCILKEINQSLNEFKITYVGDIPKNSIKESNKQEGNATKTFLNQEEACSSSPSKTNFPQSMEESIDIHENVSKNNNSHNCAVTNDNLEISNEDLKYPKFHCLTNAQREIVSNTLLKLNQIVRCDVDLSNGYYTFVEKMSQMEDKLNKLEIQQSKYMNKFKAVEECLGTVLKSKRKTTKNFKNKLINEEKIDTSVPKDNNFEIIQTKDCNIDVTQNFNNDIAQKKIETDLDMIMIMNYPQFYTVSGENKVTVENTLKKLNTLLNYNINLSDDYFLFVDKLGKMERELIKTKDEKYLKKLRAIESLLGKQNNVSKNIGVHNRLIISNNVTTSIHDSSIVYSASTEMLESVIKEENTANNENESLPSKTIDIPENDIANIENEILLTETVNDCITTNSPETKIRVCCESGENLSGNNENDRSLIKIVDEPVRLASCKTDIDMKYQKFFTLKEGTRISIQNTLKKLNNKLNYNINLLDNYSVFIDKMSKMERDITEMNNEEYINQFKAIEQGLGSKENIKTIGSQIVFQSTVNGENLTTADIENGSCLPKIAGPSNFNLDTEVEIMRYPNFYGLSRSQKKNIKHKLNCLNTLFHYDINLKGDYHIFVEKLDQLKNFLSKNQGEEYLNKIIAIEATLGRCIEQQNDLPCSSKTTIDKDIKNESKMSSNIYTSLAVFEETNESRNKNISQKEEENKTQVTVIKKNDIEGASIINVINPEITCIEDSKKFVDTSKISNEGLSENADNSIKNNEYLILNLDNKKINETLVNQDEDSTDISTVASTTSESDQNSIPGELMEYPNFFKLEKRKKESITNTLNLLNKFLNYNIDLSDDYHMFIGKMKKMGQEVNELKIKKTAYMRKFRAVEEALGKKWVIEYSTISSDMAEKQNLVLNEKKTKHTKRISSTGCTKIVIQRIDDSKIPDSRDTEREIVLFNKKVKFLENLLHINTNLTWDLPDYAFNRKCNEIQKYINIFFSEDSSTLQSTLHKLKRIIDIRNILRNHSNLQDLTPPCMIIDEDDEINTSEILNEDLSESDNKSIKNNENLVLNLGNKEINENLASGSSESDQNSIPEELMEYPNFFTLDKRKKEIVTNTLNLLNNFLNYNVDLSDDYHLFIEKMKKMGQEVNELKIKKTTYIRKFRAVEETLGKKWFIKYSTISSDMAEKQNLVLNEKKTKHTKQVSSTGCTKIVIQRIDDSKIPDSRDTEREIVLFNKKVKFLENLLHINTDLTWDLPDYAFYRKCNEIRKYINICFLEDSSTLQSTLHKLKRIIDLRNILIKHSNLEDLTPSCLIFDEDDEINLITTNFSLVKSMLNSELYVKPNSSSIIVDELWEGILYFEKLVNEKIKDLPSTNISSNELSILQKSINSFKVSCEDELKVYMRNVLKKNVNNAESKSQISKILSITPHINLLKKNNESRNDQINDLSVIRPNVMNYADYEDYIMDFAGYEGTKLLKFTNTYGILTQEVSQNDASFQGSYANNSFCRATTSNEYQTQENEVNFNLQSDALSVISQEKPSCGIL